MSQLRIRSICFLMLACLVLWGEVLFADEPLGKSIEKITHRAHFKQALFGALFVDQNSGEVVFEHAADKMFVPASTTKLFSVACAMDALGADFRFRTPVVRRGNVDDKGNLSGDLILVASGDLSFGGRTTGDQKIAFANVDHTYANDNPEAELTEPDPLSGLNELARQVATAGIKHVRGDVLIDDRLFEKSQSSGSGPSRVTPIMINDNLVDVLIKPSQVGALASWASRPQTAGIHIESKVVTAEYGNPLQITVRDLGYGRFSISGQIPPDHKPLVKILEIPDSAGFARTLFIEALQRAGVSVDAASLSVPADDALPTVAAVQALPQVALLTSLPFSESAKLILKVSHNLHASTLPLLVASKQGERTLIAGLTRQHDFLKQLGVEVDTISFAGGAGGSRSDLVTPRAAVELLQSMAKRPDFPVYRDALPRLGVDGTLAKNVPHDSPVRDKVQAKTGTLYWDNSMNGTKVMTSKALAGYMTTAKGRQLIFAMFINNAPLRQGITPKTFGDDLGKICEIVYLHE